jgi:hypothetical protein
MRGAIPKAALTNRFVAALPILGSIAAGVAVRLPQSLRPRHPVAMAATIVFGTAGITLLSPSEDRRPSLRRFVGGMAGAAISLLIVLSPAQRAALLTAPVALAVIIGALSIHLVWGVVGAFRNETLRRGNWQVRIRILLSEFIPPVVARFAAAELRVIRYAFAFRKPQNVPFGSTPFSNHQSGVLPLIWIVAGLSVIEVALVHLLIRQWSEVVAVVVSAFSELGVFYLLGVANSIRCLPILADAEGIRVRLGILIDQKFEWENIAIVELVSGVTPKRRDILRAATISAPNVRIRLREPTKVTRLFHPVREVTEVEVYLDDPRVSVLIKPSFRSMRGCLAGGRWPG